MSLRCPLLRRGLLLDAIVEHLAERDRSPVEQSFELLGVEHGALARLPAQRDGHLHAGQRAVRVVGDAQCDGGRHHAPPPRYAKAPHQGGAELMRYVSFVILHTHLSLSSVPDICRTLNESLAIQQSLKLLFSLYQVIDHISQAKTP